jgi:hypothetical protein
MFSLVGMLLLLAGYFFIAYPDTDRIESAIKNPVHESEVSDLETYDRLVKKDIQLYGGFLTKEAHHCTLIENNFPYFRHSFDSLSTQRIIAVLNDTSSYEWGEIGTPHIDQTIVYYDRSGTVIGYSSVSYDSQVYSYPYRALTKWGYLSDKGFKNLVIALRTK